MGKFRHPAVVAVVVPLLIGIIAGGCASTPVKQSWVVDSK